MLTFNALEDFLQVRPSLGLLERRDDTVISPMRFPGTKEPVRVYVRKLEGGLFFVHDNAEAAGHVVDLDALSASPFWAVFNRDWIDNGVSFDEERRLFTLASGSEQLADAVARIMEAQVVLATLALARRSALGAA